MRRQTVASFALLLILASWITGTTLAQSPTPQQPQPLPTAAELVYTVRPGETLFRIAVRFGTTVRTLAEANGIANPSLIFAGQQIRIPGVAAVTPTSVPPTSVPQPTTNYTVQRGDTLIRIALRLHTTVSALTRLNNLSSPNLIYVGQVLKVPDTTAPTPVPQPITATEVQPSAVTPTQSQAMQPASTPLPAEPTALPTIEVPSTLEPTPIPPTDVPPTLEPTAVPVVPQPDGGAVGYGFDYGIEVFMVDQDVNAITQTIQSLRAGWVKQVIYWRDFEPVEGQIDFATLDSIVDTVHNAGLNQMLTITAAPAWARTSPNENGPSDDFNKYALFVSALASRYAGKVQAYQIWNEPNLRREWNSTTQNIGAASYIQLLAAAYSAIKAADPNAYVISAGLSPTGFNDGVNAVNDRQFLSDLYAVGLANVSDAIGAHPLGWANPPDSLCCEAPVGVTTHYQDPSFFFRNTLSDYRDIMVGAADGSTPIWVTKFGWGTSEDTAAPNENQVFISYTTLGEQAIYVPRAFELGAELGYVGPMFLSNLNACQAQPDNVEPCYYSLIGPAGAPRPAFDAVKNLITPSLPLEPTIAPPDPSLPAPTPELVLTQETLPLEPVATQEATPTG